MTYGLSPTQPGCETLLIVKEQGPDNVTGGAGWAIGFGTIVAPWLGAGVLSTFTANPEASFPRLFIASYIVAVGWSAWAGIRRPHLRRGIVLGVLIAIVGVAALVALAWLTRPV